MSTLITTAFINRSIINSGYIYFLIFEQPWAKGLARFLIVSQSPTPYLSTQKH